MVSNEAALAPGARVLATDAYGAVHAGEVTRGPDRGPWRNAFVRVFIRFDGRDDEIPWPVTDVKVDG